MFKNNNKNKKERASKEEKLGENKGKVFFFWLGYLFLSGTEIHCIG